MNALSSCPWGEDLQRLPPVVPEGKKAPETVSPHRAAAQATLAYPDCLQLPDETQECYTFLAPPQEADEIGRLGGYRVLKVLGSGGMGMVFRAEDPQLGRCVALKVMLPSIAAHGTARQGFLREARAAAAVKHDHIVTIYQVGEDRGVPFLTMEFLEGESLDERLNRLSRLSQDQTLRIGREIAAGLAAAHQRGLIHRDIKPANVWLEGETGRVKIFDFGLARSSSKDSQLTQQGTIVGTPGFMAPEQASGQAFDARCDLFSLGCVLYQICTGAAPFLGQTAIATLMAVAMDQPVPPRQLNPEVTPELNDLIVRLLAKKPDQRPASAREVVDQLKAIERTLAAPPPVGAQSGNRAPTRAPQTKVQPLPSLPRPPAPARVPWWRRRVVVAAVVLAALLPLGYFRGGGAIRFATNKGQVVVEVDDPHVAVTVKEKGAVLRGPEGQGVITLPAGDHDLEVTVKDAGGKFRSFRSQVTLSRGSQAVLNVRQELNAQAQPRATRSSKMPAIPITVPKPKTGDGERRAAEWVLSLGGKITVRMGDRLLNVLTVGIDQGAMGIRVGDGVQWVSETVKELPGEAFQVVGVSLAVNYQFTDAWLEHLKELTNLTSLNLSKSSVGDAGLTHLKTLTNLNRLSLQMTQVSDTGLKHLTPLTSLAELDLNGTQVGDAGLKHLMSLTNLSELLLVGTRVGDSGLEHLKPLTKLATLNLSGTGVGNAGLELLKTLTQLTSLNLSGTGVTDAGLERLKPLTKLTSLNLGGTGVSDAGLEHLKPFAQLTSLNLGGTGVSDAGEKQLAGLLRALPRLQGLDITGTRLSAKGSATLKATFPDKQIAWSEPNRTAAEAVLALRGIVHIRPEGADDCLVNAAADLPDTYFRLTRANLAGVTKPLGDLWPKLQALTDPGFDRFQMLDLSGTTVQAHEIQALQTLPALAELSLAGTPVSDGGANALGELKRLSRLSLAGSSVTDQGLKPLQGLTGLQEVDLTQTKVTAAGVAALQKALPKCRILSGPAPQ